MNKKIYFGLAAAAMLTACSQEEVIDINMDNGNAIRVQAAPDANSRALDSYCPEVLPASFKLTATLTNQFITEGGLNEPYKYFFDTQMVIGGVLI